MSRVKQCPQCRKIYTDDELNFCLDDGSVLVSSHNPREEETVVLPPRTPAQPAPARRGVGSILAFIAVGLLALVAGGAIVAWVMTRSRTPEQRADVDTNTSRQQENRATDTPKPSPSASPSPTATPEQLDPAAVKSEIQLALNNWLKALTDKDLNGRMEFYADRLETYYTKRNVAASVVRGENVRVFDQYSELEMDISNLDVAVDKASGEVVTTFDKTFNFLGDEKDFSGSVRSEFRWRKINGRWRIVSERDLKVY